MQLALRPIQPSDHDFLYRVYASTREDELAQVSDWSDEQKASFLKMQFDAQHKFYQEQFAQAEFNIILLDQQPVGRLYLDHRPDEIRIVDIALLPAYRNQGIGSTYLNRILNEAQATGLAVRIHVERFNPALRLYHRLGFREIGENGVYYLMERIPNNAPSAETAE